jgi:hypothetical protein
MFQKLILRSEFNVILATSCNPELESCFIRECDPETENCPSGDDGDILYYKITHTRAYKIKDCVEEDSLCAMFACAQNDTKCRVEYCKEEIDQECA